MPSRQYSQPQARPTTPLPINIQVITAASTVPNMPACGRWIAPKAMAASTFAAQNARRCETRSCERLTSTHMTRVSRPNRNTISSRMPAPNEPRSAETQDGIFRVPPAGKVKIFEAPMAASADAIPSATDRMSARPTPRNRRDASPRDRRGGQARPSGCPNLKPAATGTRERRPAKSTLKTSAAEPGLCIPGRAGS